MLRRYPEAVAGGIIAVAPYLPGRVGMLRYLPQRIVAVTLHPIQAVAAPDHQLIVLVIAIFNVNITKYNKLLYK
jgi:hypothetical protein